MTFRNIFFDEGDSGGSEVEAQVTVREIEHNVSPAVAADILHLHQSPSMVVAGDEIHMNESPAWLVMGDEVHVNQSNLLLVVADEVNGEFSTIFTPKTAAIFGVAFGISWGLLSLIFRSRRR